MNKIVLALLLLSIGVVAKGQDKKDAFNKAIDYCNSKLALAYCEAYTSIHHGKEEKSFNSIRSILDCKIEAPLPFADLMKTLIKNNFSVYAQTQATELQKLKAIKIDGFTKDVAVNTIIDSIFSIPKLNSVVTIANFQNKKGELKSELEAFFDGKFPPSSKPDSGKIIQQPSLIDLEVRVSELENKINDAHGFLSSNLFVLMLSVIISIILFIILYSKLSFLTEKLEFYKESKSHPVLVS